MKVFTSMIVFEPLLARNIVKSDEIFRDDALKMLTNSGEGIVSIWNEQLIEAWSKELRFHFTKGVKDLREENIMPKEGHPNLVMIHRPEDLENNAFKSEAKLSFFLISKR